MTRRVLFLGLLLSLPGTVARSQTIRPLSPPSPSAVNALAGFSRLLGRVSQEALRRESALERLLSLDLLSPGGQAGAAPLLKALGAEQAVVLSRVSEVVAAAERTGADSAEILAEAGELAGLLAVARRAAAPEAEALAVRAAARLEAGELEPGEKANLLQQLEGLAPYSERAQKQRDAARSRVYGPGFAQAAVREASRQWSAPGPEALSGPRGATEGAAAARLERSLPSSEATPEGPVPAPQGSLEPTGTEKRRGLRSWTPWLAGLSALAAAAWTGWERGWELLSGLYASGHLQPEALRALLEPFGALAPAAFAGLQAAQVLIFFIPGEATGLLGGLAFGFTLGTAYSTVGLTLGSLAAFALARKLGAAIVRRWLPAKALDLLSRVQGPRGNLVALLLFLIPGFPKDTLAFVLGLTPMNFWAFAVISTLGRLPGTMLLSAQGAQVGDGGYLAGALLFVAAAALALPLYCFRDRILRRFDR